jgi:hypothetical protein
MFCFIIYSLRFLNSVPSPGVLNRFFYLEYYIPHLTQMQDKVLSSSFSLHKTGGSPEMREARAREEVEQFGEDRPEMG